MAQLICKLCIAEQVELRAILAGEIQILNETSVDAISHFVALANERDQRHRKQIEDLEYELQRAVKQQGGR